MPPTDRTPLDDFEDDVNHRRDSDDEAEERGHRRVHCRKHGYKGWSDDSGIAPCCYADLDAEQAAMRNGEEDEDE